MGIAPSRTELYLPSDYSLRVCSPDRCWCNGRHHNCSSPKYLYVERGGDGRERYQDPVDMVGEFFMNGGGGGLSKNPGEWTVRDYERLGEVLNEWQMRERGRRRGGGGNNYGPSPWDGSGGGDGSGRRRRTHPTRGEFDRMRDTVEDKFQRMAEEYQRHMAERDSLLFGSASDHKREQYRNNMLKTLQEILPQLSQMIAAQQMGGGGMNGGGMNMGMGMGMGMQNGMQGGIPGLGAMGGAAGSPGMGMQGGGMGMPGINVNPMMNPMAAAAAMAGGPGMGPMNTPMMPGGGMNEFGGGGVGGFGGGGFGGPGRRGRGRRERAFRDDFDDDFGGGGRRAGRPFRRGRRGGWDDEDDDLLGGIGGDGERPQGGPQRPRRPNGGDFDGGTAHQDVYGNRIDDGFRMAPPIPPQHTHFHPQPEYARSPGTDYLGEERTYGQARNVHPVVPPLRRPSPSGHPQAWVPETNMPPDPTLRPISPPAGRYWPAGSTRQPRGASVPPIFEADSVCEAVPSSMRPGSLKRATGFQPEARLSRPRDEEPNRREPEAGAVPSQRDLQ
ncbi:uncharacterized protein RCC_12128 [Ramularia collo-cygni]|uniref:Uncharacterized protein n=1 Tax=Ramularia collo-cygni TaxID=112498 RepID=A0A2D3ULF9_9PEZI|nr:uncharacterized protein RCC_12128 [Ramularia collo-cygni]CZT14802.1 uncharacterized protein RCC_12128 [Ramularia collo-cygni]